MPRVSAQGAENFPACRDLLGPERWREVLCVLGPLGREPADIPLGLAGLAGSLQLPPYLPDLARLELARALAASQELPGADRLAEATGFTVNPTLNLLELGWQGLEPLLEGSMGEPPQAGRALYLVWRPPGGEVRVRPAGPRDLLALKLAVEDIPPQEALGEAGSAAAMLDMLDGACQDGLLLSPPSRLVRVLRPAGAVAALGQRAPVFTLQWHLTQVCDLHCRHCYDREPRAELSMEQSLAVLDDLAGFCRQRRVRGQVTFTGGNPLLCENFDRLHVEAARRGFPVGLAGNPAPRKRLEAILAQAPLSFYQVSLEGLAQHNDHIRGPGHFERTLEFLKLLEDLGVYSMVSMTME